MIPTPESLRVIKALDREKHSRLLGGVEYQTDEERALMVDAQTGHAQLRGALMQIKAIAIEAGAHGFYAARINHIASEALK